MTGVLTNEKRSEDKARSGRRLEMYRTRVYTLEVMTNNINSEN